MLDSILDSIVADLIAAGAMVAIGIAVEAAVVPVSLVTFVVVAEGMDWIETVDLIVVPVAVELVIGRMIQMVQVVAVVEVVPLVP